MYGVPFFYMDFYILISHEAMVLKAHKVDHIIYFGGVCLFLLNGRSI